MKHTIFLSTIALFLVSQVMAATPTPTVTATGTPKPTSKIDDLKERLATKVAELRQTERKAMYGTVKDVTVSTFTVETSTNNFKIELTDDIKVFEDIKGKRTELTTEDLEEDDIVTIFGEFDTGLDLLRAKVVVIQPPPLERLSGVVSAVDREEFTVTVTNASGQNYIVDIEKTTNALAFDAVKGLAKGGFSRIDTGKTVHVVGTKGKEDLRISAVRIVDLGNLSGTTPTPTPTTESTPAASGSATPKATPKASTTKTPSPTPKPTTP
jgi:hypothetical protein